MRAPRIAAWAAALLAGCGSGATMASAPPCTPASAAAVASAIEIVGTAFIPGCARVAAGTAVTFTNDDGSSAHTVTTDDGQVDAFDSGVLIPSAQFVHTFATASTEQIHCNIHPSMHLTVFVQ